MDLADDFVRNIVEFSGRLAKHRKLDRIDIRDVQLNLERNWGLRIPGYATDEIKAARKWQANPEYTEKLNAISKSNKRNRLYKMQLCIIFFIIIIHVNYNYHDVYVI